MSLMKFMAEYLGSNLFHLLERSSREVGREASRWGIMLGKVTTGGKDGSLDGSRLATSQDKKSHVSTTRVSRANVSRIPANLRRSDGRPRIWCDVCNKPRHTRETCWRIHGRPASFSRNNKPSQHVPPALTRPTYPFQRKNN
ncbi:hypothetical protein NL676_008187 [Syzygium grande]|nr:hypothetical protein NL676_008187 [Syzygium grande]